MNQKGQYNMVTIKFVNGDLLEATENLILHQVNAQGKFGSGIALQVKKKWNKVYQSYKALCDTNLDSNLMGIAQAVAVGERKAVVNLFGQKYYGYNGQRYTDYEALYKALESASEMARQYNLSVAIPSKLGSERGGADWNIVYAMIESVFKNHTQPIVIYYLDGQEQKPQIQKELVLN